MKVGDIWSCAGQRFICADYRDLCADDIGHYDACIFDPPWDKKELVSPSTAESDLIFFGAKDIGRIVSRYGAPAWLFSWDLRSRWYVRNRPLRAAKYCAWYGDIKKYKQDGVTIGKPDGKPRTIKNHRGSYTFDPGDGNWLADIYACTLKQARKENQHPQGKPLDWIYALIGNCTTGVIYDPCMGGGSTALAAIRLGRKSVSVENNLDVFIETLEAVSKSTGSDLIRIGSI